MCICVCMYVCVRIYSKSRCICRIHTYMRKSLLPVHTQPCTRMRVRLQPQTYRLTHTRAHAQTHRHTHLVYTAQVCKETFTHTLHTQTQARMHARTHKRTYIALMGISHKRTQIQTHARTYTRIYTRIPRIHSSCLAFQESLDLHACMHICIYIYIYTHIHM
jgi:hypothetical protein